MANTISPPSVAVSVETPFTVLKTDPARVRLSPEALPSLSAQKTSGPLFVFTVTAAVVALAPADLKVVRAKTPVLVTLAAIVFRPDELVLVTNVVPPAVTGPFIVTLEPVRVNAPPVASELPEATVSVEVATIVKPVVRPEKFAAVSTEMVDDASMRTSVLAMAALKSETRMLVLAAASA